MRSDHRERSDDRPTEEAGPEDAVAAGGAGARSCGATIGSGAMTGLARAGLAMLVLAGAVTACGSDDESDSRRGPATAAASRVREYLAYATEELEPGSALNLIAHYERARRES